MMLLANVKDRAQYEKHKMVQVAFLIDKVIISIQEDKNVDLETKV